MRGGEPFSFLKKKEKKIFLIFLMGSPSPPNFAFCDHNYFLGNYYPMDIIDDHIDFIEAIGDDELYALRITPYPNTPSKTQSVRDGLGDFIQSLGGRNYVVGQEYERNHHFHIVFSTQVDYTDRLNKSQLRDSLYTTFDVPEDKKGNPTFSLEPVRDARKALMYAVKDGDFFFTDEWSELIQRAYETSYGKPQSMKRSLASLTEAYMKGEINDRTLWISLGQSRADLGLPLSLRWVDEMTFSIRCKKNPDLLVQKWEEISLKEALRREKTIIYEQ